MNFALPLEDRVEIEAVSTAFFVALDRFDDERILSIIADDVQWLRASGALIGSTVVRAMLASRDRTRITRHLVSNCDVCGVSATEATIGLDVVVFEGSEGRISSTSLISSRDTLRKDGRWKIALKRPSLVLKG